MLVVSLCVIKSNSWQMCGSSEGKEEDDLGLRTERSWVNPQAIEANNKNISICFWLVALKPMGTSSKYMPYWLHMHVALNQHGCIVLIWMQSIPWCWKTDAEKLMIWIVEAGLDFIHSKNEKRKLSWRGCHIIKCLKFCKIMKLMVKEAP